MTLTLVRHASAVHDNSYHDFDRPLRRKGIEKIRRNTEIMNDKGYRPDLLITSPAVRALQTAELYVETALAAGCAVELTKDYIIQVKSLYLPSPRDILDCLGAVEDKFSDVFLFSHNFGISLAAQEFCRDRSILMPTGSAVRIEFDVASWSKIKFGSSVLIDFIP